MQLTTKEPSFNAYQLTLSKFAICEEMMTVPEMMAQ